MENHVYLGFNELGEVVQHRRAAMNMRHGCAFLHMKILIYRPI